MRIAYWSETGVTMNTKSLDSELLGNIDAIWQAANYLSVSPIYLYNNLLLKVISVKDFPRHSKIVAP